jgi:hypothetical protein
MKRSKVFNAAQIIAVRGAHDRNGKTGYAALGRGTPESRLHK